MCLRSSFFCSEPSILRRNGLHRAGIYGLLHGGAVFVGGMAVGLRLAVCVHFKYLRHRADAQPAADAGVLVHNGFHGVSS